MKFTMETDINQELEDLKEIAVGKIKIAYNTAIDLEATHSVLWMLTEGKRSLLLKLTLILGFILFITICIPILFGFVYIIFIFSVISSSLILLSVGLTIYSIFQATSSINHKLILEEAISLHRQAEDFLQYKLENLDKQAYIEEIKLLDGNEKILHEKSQIYKIKLSSNAIAQINNKLDILEKSGFKKHVITVEEIDTINNKLKKFIGLRDNL
ncbi:MAG: hypothetical protein ACFFKA_09145 [Candidatus Thorarchaeota archaeon]